jgi:hypothetical protein
MSRISALGESLPLRGAVLGRQRTWINACVTRLPEWTLCLSDKLQETEYGAGEPLRNATNHKRTQFLNDLNLTVCIRSFCTKNIPAFIKAPLDFDQKEARRYVDTLHNRYPFSSDDPT